jgi:protein SCO1
MRRILCFLITVCLLTPAGGQELVKESNLTKDPEIGIVEHLGDTIPLDLTFNNEKNEKVTLRQLIDRPVILSFVYFDCPNLCSPLMAGLADVIGKVDMELGHDFKAITISFNTSDTPEKAAEKKANFVTKISKEHQNDWIYLTGEQENIKKITDAVGYKYKAQGLDFAHPSGIVIVSPQGKITRYLYGLTYLPFDLKMAIIEAQQGIARPSINKVMEFCFGYNPASKTYTLQVTRIFASIIILIALAVFAWLIIKGRKKIKT